MSTPELRSVPTGEEREMIPLSALNQFLFCPRRAALIHIEGIFKDNHHTLRGDIVHEHADLAGYQSEISNSKSQIIWWRALPVWSERLGLNGKCDIVEVETGSTSHLKSQISDLKLGGIAALKPVEFKLGKRRQWENDDVQLCAQAVCLEEMFHTAIPAGAIFHADSKRRREVEFTAELRARTEDTARQLHDLLASESVPSAEYREACTECSLFEICLPKATGANSRTERLARQLFQI